MLLNNAESMHVAAELRALQLSMIKATQTHRLLFP